MIERRKFLTGLISLVAAPAIVRAGSLMPVKADKVLRFTEIYNNRVIRTYMDVEAIRDRNVLLTIDDVTVFRQSVWIITRGDDAFHGMVPFYDNTPA